MKLYLVRHAETNYNLLKLVNSDPSVDVHLSDKGIEQAQHLAESLKDVPYEVVYISELPRTRQTAEIINQSHGKDLVVNGLLNDNRTGYENRHIDEWRAALAETPNQWEAKFNDGESLLEAANRVYAFMERLKTLNHDSVLVVTHGYITQVIYGYIQNIPLEEAYQYDLTQGTYAQFEI